MRCGRSRCQLHCSGSSALRGGGRDTILETPFVNRFCMQDMLCAIAKNQWAPMLQHLDNRLVFVWENQGVWVAATERAGDDPPVWITEECSHRETQQVWRRLDKSLSHFLVSFVLQELMFGSELLAVAPGALEKFEERGCQLSRCGSGANMPGISTGRPIFWLASASWFVVRQMRATVRTGTAARMGRARGC